MKKMILLFVLTVASVNLLNGMEVPGNVSSIIEKHRAYVEELFGARRYNAMNYLLKNGSKTDKIEVLDALIERADKKYQEASANFESLKNVAKTQTGILTPPADDEWSAGVVANLQKMLWEEQDAVNKRKQFLDELKAQKALLEKS